MVLGLSSSFVPAVPSSITTAQQKADNFLQKLTDELNLQDASTSARQTSPRKRKISNGKDAKNTLSVTLLNANSPHEQRIVYKKTDGEVDSRKVYIAAAPRLPRHTITTASSAEEICKLFKSNEDKFDASTIVTAMHFLSKQGRFLTSDQLEIVSKIQEKAIKEIDHFSSTQLAMLVGSSAKLSVSHKPLFEAVERKLMNDDKARLQTAKTIDLAIIAKSYASLNLGSENLFFYIQLELYADNRRKLITANSKDLSMLVYAFSVRPDAPRWLFEAVEQLFLADSGRLLNSVDKLGRTIMASAYQRQNFGSKKLFNAIIP